MRESKQTPFRIGGVYFDQTGDPVRLTYLTDDGYANGELHSKRDGWLTYTARFDLDTGIWGGGLASDSVLMNLLPGELHQVDGRWIALGVEKPAAVIHDSDCSLHNAPALPVGPCDCSADNAAMILRDGPAKPAAVVIPKPAEPTAKPAISGLQRVYSNTHLLGSYR